MALLEMDQICLPGDLWKRAESGDAEAREAILNRIDGLEIYMHAFPMEEGEVLITLRELEALNLVGTVTLHRAPY